MKHHHGRYLLFDTKELLLNIEGGEDVQEVKEFFNKEVNRLRKHKINSKRHSVKRKNKFLYGKRKKTS